NDGNACTIDLCVAGACRHPAAPEGASCSDGNPCNGAETCHGGVCQEGTTLNCDDQDGCMTDTCNPTSGCVHTSIPSCKPCVPTNCNDDNPCTDDICDDGTCKHSPKADGAECEDGLFCTIGDTCQAGVCRAGGPNCTYLNEGCKVGSCDESRHQCV